MQDSLSAGKDLLPVGKLGPGGLEVAVREARCLAGASFDKNLDALLFQKCADVGGRQSDALFAGADFLGYTDNHLRYPHFMVR
ncbi:hypothetical protein B27N_02228 [Alcanivorax marinus]|nr:hypothetical protein [Alloalcanivorax marinus]